jgi:hypothetical protein
MIITVALPLPHDRGAAHGREGQRPVFDPNHGGEQAGARVGIVHGEAADRNVGVGFRGEQWRQGVDRGVVHTAGWSA